MEADMHIGLVNSLKVQYGKARLSVGALPYNPTVTVIAVFDAKPCGYKIKEMGLAYKLDDLRLAGQLPP